MNYISKFLAFLFCCLSLTVQSQDELTSKNKKALKLYQEADEFFRARKFDLGIQKAEEAVQKDPAFSEAYFMLGSAYMAQAKKSQAKGYYEKGSEAHPDVVKFASAYFILGEIYFNDGEYEKAKKWLDKAVEYKPTRQYMLEIAKDLQKRAAYGIEATRKPITFVPKLMPQEINSFFIHAYPVLTADQNTLIFSKRNGPQKTDDEDIMISRFVNGEWTRPVSISPNINTKQNEGACTMAADGKTIVFTGCNREDGVGNCDLYISYNVGGEWSKPENMGANVNSKGWDSEPALSADGKTVFFTSERREGLGKEDIYISTKNENGEWSVAKNLGAPVNTRGREVSPFMHADGKTLYFSSAEHLGLGGFDIFKTTRKDSNTWSQPQNLGFPVNTAANDASVFISADNKRGIYSVYEKKELIQSKILLYEFEVPEEIKPEKVSTFAKGTVYDAETKKPIHAKINLVDLKTNNVIQSVDSDMKNGEYLMVLTEGSEYALYVEEPGYLFKSQFVDFNSAAKFDPIKMDVYLDPVKQGKAVVLNNIFFPSNSYTLEDKSRTELDKIVTFLKKNPSLKIEFGGHTDNVGSDQDNLTLSLRRAEAVQQYIVKNGIEASRLKFKGYGETQPVASNDSEEGRQKNRRIEFKVL
jgi:outer membrane protein OmpA-like peptidoglycan-associated protein